MKNKLEIIEQLKDLIKTKDWVNACKEIYKSNPVWIYNGKEVEPYEVPLLIINKLEDKELVGYLRHEYQEWASEAGDYEGGVEELIKILL